MSRITQKQVEAFRAVMIAGSMTEAASLLLVSQPAVSRLIRDLEAETRLLLFRRRGTTLVPTQTALALAEEVEHSFIGLERIASFADELRQEARGTLRIAVSPALPHGLLPAFIASFMSSAPGMRVSIDSLAQHAVIEAVSRNRADVGYTDIGLDRQGFSHQRTTLRAVAALPAAHRLASRECIVPDDFAGESFIAVRPGSLSASRVDLALTGVARDVRLTVHTSHDACALIAAGAGVSLIDPLAAIDYGDRGLTFRPFRPGVEAGFQSIRRADDAVSGSAARPALAAGLVREFHAFCTSRVADRLDPPA